MKTKPRKARDRRRRKVICDCGGKMLATTTPGQFTWYKCQVCKSTRKVVRGTKLSADNDKSYRL